VDAGDRRKSGTAKIPVREARIILRRDKSMDLIFSGAGFRGKVIALVGQMALQVKQ
jgi:hypothetical protein